MSPLIPTRLGSGNHASAPRDLRQVHVRSLPTSPAGSPRRGRRRSAPSTTGCGAPSRAARARCSPGPTSPGLDLSRPQPLRRRLHRRGAGRLQAAAAPGSTTPSCSAPTCRTPTSRDASLRRADLRGACLRNADLTGADLFEADLREGVLAAADPQARASAASRPAARARRRRPGREPGRRQPRALASFPA